jgi:glycogen debranching enzyme
MFNRTVRKFFMKRLQQQREGLIVYDAGLPNFPRNFTRDGISSAFLAEDSQMLKEQLAFCARHQGQKIDPYTGEEPGKIFHEYPGFILNEHSTEFNACDTTALFLIGHNIYLEHTHDKSLLQEQQTQFHKAVNYILSHLENHFFIESPAFCESEQFALDVTYWKDSVILDRENGKSIYPVTYTLAHIQNMCALRNAAKLLGSKELEKEAILMHEAFQTLFDEELGVFYLAYDKQGTIQGVSSDSLHALFYLQPDDLSKQQLNRIVEASKALATHAGYLTLSPNDAKRAKSFYHARTIWPFEQAIINIGALKFGLTEVAQISERVFAYLDTEPEILIQEKNGRLKKGRDSNDYPEAKNTCDPQLWTIAAKKYFSNLFGCGSFWLS